MSLPLATTVRHRSGLAIIDMRGEIDGRADDVLDDAYSEAVRDEVPIIVLNFSDVEYINSTGIALIVGLLARARQARRQLRVFGLSDHYQEIFSITRLSDFMEVYPDEASVVGVA